MICVGIDWSEEHHDVQVNDSEGKKLKSLRIGVGIEGGMQLQSVLAELSSNPADVCIAIESDHGLLVNLLVASGYMVYPLNPKAAARYRERIAIAGTKSDQRDAAMLADVVRTDRHNLRAMAGDSDLAQAVKTLARTHQRALRERRRLYNQLRSALIEFYPALLELLEASPRDALAILSKAPSPERGRTLSLSKLASALRDGGRERNVEAKAAEIQVKLRMPQLQLPPQLASAHSKEVAYLVRMLLLIEQEVVQLEKELTEAFSLHPDAEIYLSLPGLGSVLGARVLGESGDDPTRFRNARARKNYSGSAPVTKTSGSFRTVSRRVARNRWLADATFRWAFSSLRGSPGADAYYRQLRGRGKTHNQASRQVAQRWTGILHACLRDHSTYLESTAWPNQVIQVAA